MPSEKKKGIIGTAIIHFVLLILLLVVAFTPPKPPELEEGILVNFGTDESGLGEIEPSSPPVQEVAPPPPSSADTRVQEEEPLLTQNTEDAPEVKKIDPEAEKKRLEKIEADRKLREQMEEERIRKEQEEIERKRIEAEQKRQADIKNRTRDALASSKASGTTSTGEGDAGGRGNQGVPTGSVDSKVRGDGAGLGTKGISYDLQGRGFQSLPAPQYDYQGEGRVVVDVSVDRSGKVTQAIPGAKGSTTLDEYLLRVAKDAAMKARFDPKPDAPVTQKGTITYNFILK
ncbi:MAG: TonB family protein [Bacteroidales bacterium]|nr:TonB family protein [Bacteroidales bacterium]